MAYTDSGLGWYANSDWMTDETGTIAELSTGGGGGSFRCYDPNNGQDMYLGILDGSSITIYSDTTCYCACGSTFFTAPQNPYSDILIMAPAGTESADLHTNYGYRHIHLQDVTYGSYTVATYYIGWNRCVWTDNQTLLCDPIPTDNDPNTIEFAKYVSGGPGTTIEYAKSSAGYSVTCMCKWNEAEGGDVYISPVLISTVNNNTFWTVNGQTPIQQLTEHTWQGVNFFMRLYKTHLFDPDETITANFPVLDIVEEEAYSSTNDVFRFIALAAELGAGALPEEDPYSEGGESGPGAGTPTFDFTSTDIPVPGLPNIGAYNAGFLTLYKPTSGELGTLASYMWSGSFDPDNFRKLFANPMDAILGLHIIPATASHPTSTGASLRVGNIDTQISMNRLTEQYYELDCGTINVEPKWGAYLDYAPYSKLTLYLPYIGFVPISPDDCMDGSINVKYHVDVLSGACCVYVYCTSNHGTDTHVLYTYTGACACDCPVTEGQYTNAVLGILNIAGGVAGAISGALTGNAGGLTGGIESAANAALSMVKPDISRSGSFGGSAGLMGIQYPYLVLTVPRMCTPGEQQKQIGYPSYITKALGELTGYNLVHVSRLEGMSCTANETEEILTLLEGGAIF